MEHLPEDNSEKKDISVEEMPAASLGKTLREARENLGLSILDVAGQIKFAPRQIEALEADDFKHLPEMAFVRGFVRSYAKILKLDAQSLLATLTQAKEFTGELTPASVEVPFPDTNLAQRQNLVWLGLALLLVLLVVFAMNNFTQTPFLDKVTRVETPVFLPAEIQVSPDTDNMNTAVDRHSESGKTEAGLPIAGVQPSKREVKILTPPVSQQTQTEVLVVPSDPPTPSGTLRIEFDDESWVEIKDRDDNILLSQVYQPGSDLQLEGNAPLSVLIGHAPSVRLYYRDKQIDLAPHTRHSTDVAYLKLK